jgi:protein TonB
VSSQPINAASWQGRTSAGFFRWEEPGEPIAIHFHLNTVELLERDVVRNGKAHTAGILLGRRDESRDLTFTVENYEPIPPATWKSTDSAFGDPRQLKGMIDRWQNRSEKRISVLGFYRSCVAGETALTEDDLAVLSLNSGKPESIFLLIEPQTNLPSTGRLFLCKDGAATFEWPAIPFNRSQLSGRGFPRPTEVNQPPPVRRPEPLRPEPSRPEPPRVPNFEDETQVEEEPSESAFHLPKFSRPWIFGLAIFIVGALLLTGLFLRLGGVRSTGSGAPSTEQAAPVNLGLKLDRAGSDWKLSWNRDSAALAKATGGALVITDGPLSKTVNLDASDLRRGSVIYSPLTDDLVIRLQVNTEDSTEPVTDSVRIVGGLPSTTSGSINAEANSAAITINPPAGSPQSESLRLADEELKKIAPPTTSATVNAANGLNPNAKRESPRSGAKLPEDSLTVSRALSPTARAKAHQAPSTGSSKVAANSKGPAVASKPAEPVSPGDPVRAPAESIPVIPASSASSAAAGFAPSVTRYARKGGAVQPALLLTNINPIYPAEAKEAGISGPVEVRFKISAMGDVHDVVVVKGPEILGQAAVDAVHERRYKPARVDGVPTETDASAIFEFKLN